LSNDAEDPAADERRRANILEYNPDGSGFRIFATGQRNSAGIAMSSAYF
jgi:glucose/arabinose dehydrogenase